MASLGIYAMDIAIMRQTLMYWDVPLYSTVLIREELKSSLKAVAL